MTENQTSIRAGLSQLSSSHGNIEPFSGQNEIIQSSAQINLDEIKKLDYRTTVLISGRQRKVWQFE